MKFMVKRGMKVGIELVMNFIYMHVYVHIYRNKKGSVYTYQVKSEATKTKVWACIHETLVKSLSENHQHHSMVGGRLFVPSCSAPK